MDDHLKFSVKTGRNVSTTFETYPIKELLDDVIEARNNELEEKPVNAETVRLEEAAAATSSTNDDGGETSEMRRSDGSVFQDTEGNLEVWLVEVR